MFKKIYNKIIKNKFLSENEIVADIIKNENSKDILLNKKDELILLHFSLGMHIRNHYKLWDKNNPITNYGKYDPDSDHHPDQISFRIIEKVYDYWNNQ